MESSSGSSTNTDSNQVISSMLSPLLLKKIQEHENESDSESSIESSYNSDFSMGSSNSPAFFSALYLLHMNDNKHYYDEKYKTEKSTTSVESVESNVKLSYSSTSKISCPHTGLPDLIPVRTGRLTAHFKLCHAAIPSRFVTLGYDEYFILKTQIPLHHTSCFCRLNISSQTFANTVFLLMVNSHYEELANKRVPKVHIFILTDETRNFFNVVLTYYDAETIECRVRTIEDPPGISNCLNLSPKAARKFCNASGDELILKMF